MAPDGAFTAKVLRVHDNVVRIGARIHVERSATLPRGSRDLVERRAGHRRMVTVAVAWAMVALTGLESVTVNLSSLWAIVSAQILTKTTSSSSLG